MTNPAALYFSGMKIFEMGIVCKWDIEMGFCGWMGRLGCRVGFGFCGWMG